MKILKSVYNLSEIKNGIICRYFKIFGFDTNKEMIRGAGPGFG